MFTRELIKPFQTELLAVPKQVHLEIRPSLHREKREAYLYLGRTVPNRTVLNFPCKNGLNFSDFKPCYPCRLYSYNKVLMCHCCKYISTLVLTRLKDHETSSPMYHNMQNISDSLENQSTMKTVRKYTNENATIHHHSNSRKEA